MTSSSHLPPANRNYGRVLGEAFAIAAAVVCAVAGLVWLTGLIAGGHGAFLAMGVAAALGSSGAALLVHGRILAMRSTGANDGALLAGRLQGLLGAVFLIKLVVIGIAVVAMRLTGVKFEAIAVFGVTFAAASVVGQVISAGLVARAIAKPHSKGGTAVTRLKDSNPSPNPGTRTTPPC